MNTSRIVSLLPGCTEVVCALGLEDQLIGRSHECDFPPSVRRLPVCTEAKVDLQASSSAIDRQVKQHLQEALSIYRIDMDTLKELKPDVILTQAQCEVCAVSLAEVEEAVSQWTSGHPQIISFSPAGLGDLWDDTLRVAEALGVPGRGQRLVDDLKTRCASLGGRIAHGQRRPSVACIEWLEPLMAAGNWVPDLVELAGGLSLFGEAGKHSPWLNWEAVLEHDPEIIVIMPCGFDIARSRREMPALTAQADWDRLRAVRNQRVYLADGNQYFNRPGPRLVESLEILAEMIHPQIVHFGHKGIGWQEL